MKKVRVFLFSILILAGMVSQAGAIPNGAAFKILSNGCLMVAGGYDSNNQASSLVSVYNPHTDTYYFTGSMNYARANPRLIELSDGRIVVMAGYQQGGSGTGVPMVRNIEIYDPSTGIWTTSGALPDSEISGGALSCGLLGENKIFVASYRMNGTTSVQSYFIYDVESTLWTILP